VRIATSPEIASTLRSSTCGLDTPIWWPRAPGSNANASLIATSPEAVR
jgi:hypothetical protein